MPKGKSKKRKKRNYVAYGALLRRWGAGHHGNKKAERSKKGCRGKVVVQRPFSLPPENRTCVHA